jgi:hypothetical protein
VGEIGNVHTKQTGSFYAGLAGAVHAAKERLSTDELDFELESPKEVKWHVVHSYHHASFEWYRRECLVSHDTAHVQDVDQAVFETGKEVVFVAATPPLFQWHHYSRNAPPSMLDTFSVAST